MKIKFITFFSKYTNIFGSQFSNAIILSSSQLFSISFNFLSTIIIAKELSIENFGYLSICLTIFSILAIITELGFIGNIGTILTKNNLKESDIFGFSIITSLILSIIFLLLIILIYEFIGLFYQIQIKNILINTSLLSFSFIYPYILPFIFSGSGKIKTFSLFNFANNFIYFIFIIVQTYLFKNNNINYYINFKSISILITILFVFFHLKPTFKNQFLILKLVYNNWKKFGRHCYIGRLYNSTIPFLLVLIVGYTLSEKSAAIFRLSFNFINPLLIIFLSFTQSYAKKVANMQAIPKKTINLNLIISIILVIISSISCYILIKYFLNNKYNESFLLYLIMLICCFLYGNYRLYYEWLALNGYGEKIMNISKFSFLFVLMFSVPLMKMFGIYGASLTLVGSFSISTILVFYNYNSIIKEKNYEKQQKILNTFTK